MYQTLNSSLKIQAVRYCRVVKVHPLMQPLRAAAHSKRMASEREDVPPRSVNPRVLRLTCPDADHTADHRSRSTSLRHPRPTTVRRRYDDTPSDLDQTFFADRSGVRSLRSFSSAELCFSSFSTVMPWVHSFIQLSACRAGLSQSLLIFSSNAPVFSCFLQICLILFL